MGKVGPYTFIYFIDPGIPHTYTFEAEDPRRAVPVPVPVIVILELIDIFEEIGQLYSGFCGIFMNYNS